MNSKFRMAFTLAEVLTAIAIITIVFGISYPAFSRAKESAKITRCFSNFKQIFAAVELYRTDHDGTGKYGTIQEMGLPPDLKSLAIAEKLDHNIFTCMGRPLSDLGVNLYTQRWHIEPMSNIEPWSDYVEIFEDSAFLLNDTGHDIAGTQGAFHKTHSGIGLTVGGAAFNRTRWGNPMSLKWWHDNWDEKVPDL